MTTIADDYFLKQEQEKQEIKNLYQEFDMNHDSVLQLDEFTKLI